MLLTDTSFLSSNGLLSSPFILQMSKSKANYSHADVGGVAGGCVVMLWGNWVCGDVVGQVGVW